MWIYGILVATPRDNTTEWIATQLRVLHFPGLNPGKETASPERIPVVI